MEEGCWSLNPMEVTLNTLEGRGACNNGRTRQQQWLFPVSVCMSDNNQLSDSQYLKDSAPFSILAPTCSVQWT